MIPLEFLIGNLIPQEFIFVIDVIALRYKFFRINTSENL